jgi:uncharacterized protein (TIGR02646 family)
VRRVFKGQEPPSFAAWKALENEDWTPSFGVLQNPQKGELHLALLREQGFTCCYCGREIDLAGSHIEHFRPQWKFEDLELDYENLFASCQRGLCPGSPSVCGHLKDDNFDEATFLSPILPTIEDRFSYTDVGEVRTQDEAAQVMIDVLGLNASFLTSRRSEAIRSVFDPTFIASATEEELSRIAIDFRSFGEDGKLSSFFHAVARFAEDLV